MWIGADFQLPNKMHTDNSMDICSDHVELSFDNIVKWGKSIDVSTISCKNKSELFSVDSLQIQR